MLRIHEKRFWPESILVAGFHESFEGHDVWKVRQDRTNCRSLVPKARIGLKDGSTCVEQHTGNHQNLSHGVALVVINGRVKPKHGGGTLGVFKLGGKWRPHVDTVLLAPWFSLGGIQGSVKHGSSKTLSAIFQIQDDSSVRRLRSYRLAAIRSMAGGIEGESLLMRTAPQNPDGEFRTGLAAAIMIVGNLARSTVHALLGA